VVTGQGGGQILVWGSNDRRVGIGGGLKMEDRLVLVCLSEKNKKIGVVGRGNFWFVHNVRPEWGDWVGTGGNLRQRTKKKGVHRCAKRAGIILGNPGCQS